MKRFLLSLLLVIPVVAFAQAPQKFNYQAIARDVSGDALTSQSIGLRMSILQGSQTGSAVYTESHSATTDQFGHFSLEVGSGTIITGTFSAIDWGNGPYYLNVEMDASGGMAYQQMGVAQLISVPYALYAAAGVGSVGPTGPPGAAGLPGANGVNGMNGAAGPAGPTGATGPTGADAQLPTGTEGQTLIHNGSEWVASNKIKCNTPADKVDITGEGIRVLPPIPLPPVGEQDEADLEREFLRFQDDINRVLELLKTGTGGELKAEDGNGGEVKVELDAVDELVKILTGKLIVLPDPGSDEEAEVAEDHVRFEKELESALEALRTATGGEIKAEDADGDEVKVILDAVNEMIEMITGAVVVLPTPTSDEQARLDEETLEFLKAAESAARLLREQSGARIEGEDLGSGDVVGMSFDATNGAIVDDASTRVQQSGDVLFLREQLTGPVRTEMHTLDLGTPTAQPAGVAFVPDPSNPQVIIDGWLAKPGGSFRIDHPLDPDNKYLYHSFVESPDMMNLYNGNVTTDENGVAVVEMPSYFSALNKDFRYQLTVIGTFAQAIIAKEMADGRFEIKTDQPNVKVSWQVTGVRNDDYAKTHRMKVEVEKEEGMKGKRLFKK